MTYLYLGFPILLLGQMEGAYRNPTSISILASVSPPRISQAGLKYSTLSSLGSQNIGQKLIVCTANLASWKSHWSKDSYDTASTTKAFRVGAVMFRSSMNISTLFWSLTGMNFQRSKILMCRISSERWGFLPAQLCSSSTHPLGSFLKCNLKPRNEENQTPEAVVTAPFGRGFDKAFVKYLDHWWPPFCH